MNDRLEKKPPAPGRRISIALAIAVHLVLAMFLFYGVHWQSERPEAVEVELVRALPAPSTPAPAPAPEVKPEPRPEPPPPPPEPKPAPHEPEIAVKEKPPKKEKAKPPPPKEMARPIPKEAPKALPKPPPPNPFADALKREDEQLARNEAQAAAARELQQIDDARRKAAAESAMAAYIAKISETIRRNLTLPPGVKGNPEAVVDVTQLPSGEVLSVRLTKSSGHSALDRAIERAITKSSPLPKPDSPGLFQRQLVLSFKPLEE